MRKPISATARKNHLAEIAQTQHGYFTTRQAVATGYTTNNHQFHLDQGNWLKISSGLFRLPGYPDSMEAEFTKWCLWSRNQQDQPQGIVSHASALAFFGWGEYDAREIHLTVPLRFRKPAPAEVVLHKASLHLSYIEPHRGFMVTRPAKTLADLRDFLTARRQWETTVAAAYAAGKLSGEEYRGFGLAPPPTARDTVGEIQEPPAAAVPALMRERIYAVIFQQTQLAGQGSRRRRQAGFTLVELLVVMAIITILAGMLLPVLNQVTSVARRAQCQSNQKQILLAWNLYADSHSEALPMARSDAWLDYSGPTLFWAALVSEFTGEGPCPDKYHFGRRGGVFFCPELAGNTLLIQYSAYGMNLYAPGGRDYGTLKGYKKRTNIAKPSAQLLIHDSWDSNNDNPAVGMFYVVNPLYTQGNVSFRHDRSGVAGFPDGHSAPTRYDQLCQTSAEWPNTVPWGWGFN